VISKQKFSHLILAVQHLLYEIPSYVEEYRPVSPGRLLVKSMIFDDDATPTGVCVDKVVI
jgi:hypothetical protein